MYKNEPRLHPHHMDFGCCFPPRRFLTKDEQIERLEKYAKELDNVPKVYQNGEV